MLNAKLEFGFKVCRVCLTPNSHEFLSTMYTGKVAKMLHEVSSINIFPDQSRNHDALICAKCLKDLEKAYYLRKTILRYDEFYFQPRRDKSAAIVNKASDDSTDNEEADRPAAPKTKAEKSLKMELEGNLSNGKSLAGLPEEVLLKIFQYLLPDDLKEASLVCKRMDDIISNSSQCMQHLPLVLSLLSHELLIEVLTLSRAFFKIEIKEIELNENLYRTIEKHGGEVRQLVCRNINIPSDIDFMRMLETLPKLEKISFEEVIFNCYSENENPVTMHCLKHIVVKDCHPAILNYIDTTNVSILKQSNFSFPIHVKPLPNLQTLVLRRKSIEPDSEMIMSSHLKKLSVAFLGDEMISSILLQVKDTLEELEIAENVSLDVFAIVFSQLKKLNVLEINADRLPQARATSLKPNQSVKTLIINSNQNVTNLLEDFIGHLPNLETLIMNCAYDQIYGNQLFTFISTNLPKLRVLELRVLEGMENNALLETRFPSLRELHVETANVSATGWQMMIQSCSNIEKLSVQNEPYWDANSLLSSENQLEVVSRNLQNLKHFYCGAGFAPLAKTGIEHLWQNCSKLISFTIVKSDDTEEQEATIADFLKTGPRLIVAEKRVNFSCAKDWWDGEDVVFTSYEAEYDEFRSVYGPPEFQAFPFSRWTSLEATDQDKILGL